MRRECRVPLLLGTAAPSTPGAFSERGLAIPTCITARARHTCRDACQDRQLAVSFEVGGGENVPGIPGARATRNFSIWEEAHGRIALLGNNKLTGTTRCPVSGFQIGQLENYQMYHMFIPPHLQHPHPHSDFSHILRITQHCNCWTFQHFCNIL